MQHTETLAPANTNLLRPRQVDDAKHEIKSLEEQLRSPHIEDKGEVNTKLRRVRKSFEQQAPRPAENPAEEDRMVKRSRQLLTEILEGMPSQEEMRKAPPGAVDKHIRWEKANKAKIVEWKNLQLRLTAGSGDNEVANLERFRPRESSLSMDNAVIPGKQYHLPPHDAGLPVTFTSEQLTFLRAHDPELADMIGSLTNRQRAEVKEAINGIGLANKPKRTISPEHKQKMLEGARRAREAKKQS